MQLKTKFDFVPMGVDVLMKMHNLSKVLPHPPLIAKHEDKHMSSLITAQVWSNLTHK